MAAAGALFGGAALLSSAFSLAMEQADLPGIMQVQFGLTEEAAAASAEAAANVYAGGWGASLGEVGTAVGEINRQLEDLGQTGDVEALTTSAQALADTFGEEVGGVITSASQLVKTGLVPDMQAGFDVMAAGFQAGLDPADDFLDTITEYSVQFQTLGLDATTAFGLIDQGLEGGARNADLVADAIKEFAIRAIDGSETTKAGFDAIGLSAEEMAAKFAAGGPEAAAAFDTVLDRLREMEDPVARDAAAVALFGTQAEDLNQALYSLDPSEAANRLGEVSGAATEVAETTGGGTQAQITALGRAFQDSLASALVTLAPLLGGLLQLLTPLAPILGPLAIAIGVITVAQWLWNAALMASPITWIILAVVALIAIIVLLVVHWDTVSAALVAAWNWIKDTAVTVWNAIKDFFAQWWPWLLAIFTGGGSLIVDWIIDHWDEIKQFTSDVWNGIKAFFVGIWNAIVTHVRGQVTAFLAVMNWFKELPGKIADWFGQVKDSAVNKLTSLVDWVKGLPGRIQDAIGDLGSLLYNAGKDILQGLLDGISSMWNSVQDKLGDLTNSLPDWKGPEAVDKQLLRKPGQWVIGGLIEGMDDEIPAVKSLLAGVTTDIGMSMAPPGGMSGGTAALSDEDRELLRELAQSRNRVDVRLGANLTAASQREYAMAVA